MRGSSILFVYTSLNPQKETIEKEKRINWSIVVREALADKLVK